MLNKTSAKLYGKLSYDSSIHIFAQQWSVTAWFSSVYGYTFWVKNCISCSKAPTCIVHILKILITFVRLEKILLNVLIKYGYKLRGFSCPSSCVAFLCHLLHLYCFCTKHNLRFFYKLLIHRITKFRVNIIFITRQGQIRNFN